MKKLSFAPFSPNYLICTPSRVGTDVRPIKKALRAFSKYGFSDHFPKSEIQVHMDKEDLVDLRESFA